MFLKFIDSTLNAKFNSNPKFSSVFICKLTLWVLLVIFFACDFPTIISAADCNSSPLTLPKNCETLIAEITVAVDVSFSEATERIWIPKIKSILTNIIDRINTRNTVRVRQVIHFDQFVREPTETNSILPNDKVKLKLEINQIKQPPSSQRCQGTNIKETLKRVLLEHTQSLTDVLWVFFIFTDGYFDPNDINEIRDKIGEIKKNSEVIVIASADQYDGDMLQILCEPKCDTNLIHLDDNYERIYEHLNELTICKCQANLFSYPCIKNNCINFQK